jgi:hypothetical protein
MARVTKVNLIVGAVCTVVGLLVTLDVLDGKAHPWLTVALPAGAICLGLFFIFYIFENETARYDAEQRARLPAEESAPPEKTDRTAGRFGRPVVVKH